MYFNFIPLPSLVSLLVIILVCSYVWGGGEGREGTADEGLQARYPMREANLRKHRQRVCVTFKARVAREMSAEEKIRYDNFCHPGRDIHYAYISYDIMRHSIMATNDVDEVGKDIAGGFTELVTPALV